MSCRFCLLIGIVLLQGSCGSPRSEGPASDVPANTQAEAQVAELQGKIAKWQSNREKLKKLIEQMQNDKTGILEKLVQLGVTSETDLANNPKGQVLHGELKDIVRQIALYDKKYQDYDLAVLKSESRVRNVARQLAAREAGVSDTELEELTRSMVTLDEALSSEKEAAVPLDPEDTLKDELARYHQGQQAARTAKPTDATTESGDILVATPQKMPSMGQVTSRGLGGAIANKESKRLSLDGEWILVDGWLSGGAKMTGPRWSNCRIVFKGTQYTKLHGATAIEGRVEVDTTTSPMRLDWTPLKGGTPKFWGKKTPGIFEISGDGSVLRFCAGESEGARPVEFDYRPDGWTVQVYKRTQSIVTGPAPPEPEPSQPAAARASNEAVFSLFDGTSLKGWHCTKPTGTDCWVVRNGELVCTPQRKGKDADLATDRSFRNFELDLEFLLEKAANSGVFLRGLCEVQLYDDTSEAVPPEQRCGAIWRRVAPSKEAYLGPGRWNTLKVKMIGQRVTVTMNGERIIDDAYVSDSSHQNPPNATTGDLGPITLQCHSPSPGPMKHRSWSGGMTRFRNISIKPIGE